MGGSHPQSKSQTARSSQQSVDRTLSSLGYASTLLNHLEIFAHIYGTSILGQGGRAEGHSGLALLLEFLSGLPSNRNSVLFLSLV